MCKEDAISKALAPYLPAAAVQPFCLLLKSMPLQMTISRPRHSKFGDFKAPTAHKAARISVNGDLPKPAFLLTAVHELAHAKVYFDYRENELYRRLPPHGEEWKKCFKELMQAFLNVSIYPEPTLSIVKKHMENPAASSVRDKALFEALHMDTETKKLSPNTTTIDRIQNGNRFEYKGRVFVRLHKLRTYIKCEDLENKRLYRIHPSAQVKEI